MGLIKYNYNKHEGGILHTAFNKSKAKALMGGNYIYIFTFSDGSGTRNLGFGLWKCRGEMGLKKGKLAKNEEKHRSTCHFSTDFGYLPYPSLFILT